MIRTKKLEDQWDRSSGSAAMAIPSFTDELEAGDCKRAFDRLDYISSMTTSAAAASQRSLRIRSARSRPGHTTQ